MTTFDEVPYGGWSRCYQVSNGQIDLVITGEIGPRIIRFGFVDQPNEFCEVKESLGKTGGDTWYNYGGHRLWHAPEVHPRTYQPDNTPIDVQEREGTVYVNQPTEAATGITKSLEITMSESENYVKVVHHLKNDGLWPVELAPWALSVMGTGGKGILPLPPRGTHPEDLLPSSTLTIWPYTHMNDPRWTWGQQYILLQQETGDVTSQKIGASDANGWLGYARDNHLFLKLIDSDPRGTYPDMGSMVEMYTCDFMLELETLGQLVTLEPGQTATHIENWFLFDGVPLPQTDADVDAHILPLVNAAQGKV